MHEIYPLCKHQTSIITFVQAMKVYLMYVIFGKTAVLLVVPYDQQSYILYE